MPFAPSPLSAGTETSLTANVSSFLQRVFVHKFNKSAHSINQFIGDVLRIMLLLKPLRSSLLSPGIFAFRSGFHMPVWGFRNDSHLVHLCVGFFNHP